MPPAVVGWLFCASYFVALGVPVFVTFWSTRETAKRLRWVLGGLALASAAWLALLMVMVLAFVF